MLENGGGKIINIASMQTFQGGIRVPSDTAFKADVGGLTKRLANEWATKGINVNAIVPAISRPTTSRSYALMPRATSRSSIVSRQGAVVTSPISVAPRRSCKRCCQYLRGHIFAVDGGWPAR